MAISAQKVGELGTKLVSSFKLKMGLGTTMKIQTRDYVTEETAVGQEDRELVKIDTTASEFLEGLEAAIETSKTDQSTVPIDTLLYHVFKPSFPYKDWMYSAIDESDKANADKLADNNGSAIPADVFTQDELASYAKMTWYACGDAAIFAGRIANDDDDHRVQVENRAFRPDQDASRSTNAALAKASSPGDLSSPPSRPPVSSATRRASTPERTPPGAESARPSRGRRPTRY